MVHLHWLCYLLACVAFAVAACPPARIPIRWEWLAAALLTLTLVV